MAQVATTETQREKLRGESVRDVFESARDLGATDLMRARAAETRATTAPMVDLLGARSEALRSGATLATTRAEAIQDLTPERVKAMQTDEELARKLVQEFFPFKYKDEEFQVRGRNLLAALGGNTGMSVADKVAVLRYNQSAGSERGVIEPTLISDPDSPRARSEYQNWNRTSRAPYAYILDAKGKKVEPILLPPVKIAGQWVQMTAEEFQAGVEGSGLSPRRYMEMLQSNYGRGGNLTAQEMNFDLIGE